MYLLPIGIVGIGIAALIRNQMVFKFRQKMIAAISTASQVDIYAGRDWTWRYQTFNTVTYDEMMLRFWRPLRATAWYGSDDFLRVTEAVQS